jgi:hypothetical protein
MNHMLLQLLLSFIGKTASRMLILAVLLCNTAYSGRTELDEILAVLPHPAGDILILASDLQMTFDGTTRTFREVVLDGLMELKARDIGIKTSEAMLESMMASIQKKYSLTQSQLIELFEAQGLTLEEARELLKRRKMIDDLLGGVMHVDEPSTNAIEEYYKSHPDIIEATYCVRLAFVPESDMTLQELESMIKSGSIDEKIIWDEHETYRASDLSETQRFVTTMQPNEVRIMAMVDGGYDLAQLVSINPEQIAPLDEEKISRVLRQEIFLNALREFQEKLIEKAKIRFCRSGLSLDVTSEKEIID